MIIADNQLYAPQPSIHQALLEGANGLLQNYVGILANDRMLERIKTTECRQLAVVWLFYNLWELGGEFEGKVKLQDYFFS